MTKTLFALSLLLGFQISNAPDAHAFGGHRYPELKTVSYVELERYLGKWHQIALLPNRFQKGCTLETTATYSLREDGLIQVLNACTRDDGTRKDIIGKAKVMDTVTGARLGVKFFFLQPYADYWIIDLGADYEYAVVGEPSRKYLWVLAREASLSRHVYEGILERVKAQGFDTSKLLVTGLLE